jgi:hypothetical protein
MRYRTCYACILGGACSSCHEPLERLTHHAHIYHPDSARDEALCGACFEMMASAALPVLMASEQARRAGLVTEGLLDLLRRGAIVVGVQGQLPT